MRDGRLQEAGHVDRNFGHWAVFTEIFGVDEVAVGYPFGVFAAEFVQGLVCVVAG